MELFWRSQRYAIVKDNNGYGISNGHDIQYPEHNNDGTINFKFDTLPKFVKSHYRKLLKKNFMIDQEIKIISENDILKN